MKYSTYEAQFKKEFFEIISIAQNILITSHISPDEDSIGSVLAMYTLLNDTVSDANIRICYSGLPVTRFKSFSNFDKVEFVEDVAHEMKNIDLVIFLDGGQYSRFSRMPEKLKSVPKTICIDHHASIPDDFTLSLIDTSSVSTTELIYSLADGDKISKDFAEAILMGLLGDTGNFSFLPPEKSAVFDIAKKLVSIIEIPIDVFQSRYRAISQREFTLVGILIKNTRYIDTRDWPGAQYSFLDVENVEKGKYTDEEVSAANHIYMGAYLRSIEGYTWGFVVTPRTLGDWRISGRSLPGSVNVRKLFEELGIGGGHDRASGGSFKGENLTSEICVQKIVEWMKKNKPSLK